MTFKKYAQLLLSTLEENASKLGIRKDNILPLTKEPDAAPAIYIFISPDPTFETSSSRGRGLVELTCTDADADIFEALANSVKLAHDAAQIISENFGQGMKFKFELVDFNRGMAISTANFTFLYKEDEIL